MMCDNTADIRSAVTASRRSASTSVNIVTADDDDENRFLDDFSGSDSLSKSHYYDDVTSMTSHGHLATGND